jgi:hypothetical protein
MTQRRRNKIGALLATLAVAVTGCEQEVAAPAANLAGALGSPPVSPTAAKTSEDATPSSAPRGHVDAKGFDLDAAAALIRDSKVKTGKELEQALNRSPKHRVDMDGDRRRDPIQVVERRSGDERTFEVRAIPSSRARRPPDSVAIPIATITVAAVGPTARVTVRYADTAVVTQPPVIVFEMPIVVATFVHWVLVVERPIFVGVVLVIETDHRKHKHKHKHKKGRW